MSTSVSPARFVQAIPAVVRVSFGLRPITTPRDLAPARPSPVRLRINSRSNSAKPPARSASSGRAAQAQASAGVSNDVANDPRLELAATVYLRLRSPYTRRCRRWNRSDLEGVASRSRPDAAHRCFTAFVLARQLRHCLAGRVTFGDAPALAASSAVGRPNCLSLALALDAFLATLADQGRTQTRQDRP